MAATDVYKRQSIGCPPFMITKFWVSVYSNIAYTSSKTSYALSELTMIFPVAVNKASSKVGTT